MRFGPIPSNTAISLFQALLTARGLQLQPALAQAVQVVGVLSIDSDLHRLVPASTLNYLASLHLRGERVFPVPSIIRHAPQLIGYYRMLLGISKKGFSQARKLGYGPWANAEAQNMISAKLDPYVEDFCKVLITPLVQLVDATKSLKPLDDRDLNDLALLTLGPTLQGGRNNVIGQQAAKGVFDALSELVAPWAILQAEAFVQFRTPPGIAYELAVGSDPDIRLDELIVASDTVAARRPIVAMEIKGGRDISNAHNRAGEAEKSHIKAAALGYHHRWTIIVMQGLDRKRIETETPSSTDIFDADEIRRRSGTDWDNLRQELSAVIGMPVG